MERGREHRDQHPNWHGQEIDDNREFRREDDQERKDLRRDYIYFIVWSLISLVLTFAVLVSCSDYATSAQNVITITPSNLALDLASWPGGGGGPTFNATALVEEALSGSSALPDEYHIGVSGACRQYYNTSVRICRHRFPQKVDLRVLLGQDIGTNSVQFEAWSVLIDWGSNMENNHALLTNLAQAAAALFILSVMLNLVILFLAVKDFRHRDHLDSIKVLAWIDAVLILGPAIMWTYMQMNVASSSSDASVDFGGGLVLLWLAFVAKVAADKRIVRAIIRSACCRALNNPRSRFNRSVHGFFDDAECGIAWLGLNLAGVPAKLTRGPRSSLW